MNPNKFVLRSQLQVDASPRLKQAVKEIAVKAGKNLKQVVLGALGDKYPQLRPYVKSDLGEYFSNADQSV